jgi:hypothetical protein
MDAAVLSCVATVVLWLPGWGCCCRRKFAILDIAFGGEPTVLPE